MPSSGGLRSAGAGVRSRVRYGERSCTSRSCVRLSIGGAGGACGGGLERTSGRPHAASAGTSASWSAGSGSRDCRHSPRSPRAHRPVGQAAALSRVSALTSGPSRTPSSKPSPALRAAMASAGRVRPLIADRDNSAPEPAVSVGPLGRRSTSHPEAPRVDDAGLLLPRCQGARAPQPTGASPASAWNGTSCAG